MNLRSVGFLAVAALAATSVGRSQPAQPSSHELIRVDSEGVMRWRTTGTEVAMLGANYCLPSASDYRAAGVVNADRKKLIDQDMTHFVRMGWDALRLSFWGDWECCDKDGNLIANDHLDLLDYLIYTAKRRDLHMLLSPIVTYSSMWPDGDDPAAVGFSRYYKKEELGTNPKAIAAQVNYLTQLLNHVNPYTKVALKDEPYICYLELINEPWHHPDDFAGSVRYINALNDAVRATGCQKITFFNLSQDFAMAKAIAASRVDGVSFAWYPTGLVSGHRLRGNFLRTVDDYPPMLAPEISRKPKLVYEYDMADVMSGYHYPAMVRTFRSVGAQSAAMFSYDMLATAPYNLGWQTHCLNMVYTPQKAASAIIASQVMRRIPRMQPVGTYPANTRFGDFRVSYEENLSELVSSDLFYYSNNTKSAPPEPAKLRRIVGFGSSPIVSYEGAGLYFLDRIEDGVWRLEVYPDSIQIDDPFAPTSVHRLVFDLITRTWPMTINLPDLGNAFTVEPINDGNSFSPRPDGASFGIRPGVYILSRTPRSSPANLPDRIPNLPYYLGMREFVCPTPPPYPTCVVLRDRAVHDVDQPMTVTATIASANVPDNVSVSFSDSGMRMTSMKMIHSHGYEYEVTVPAGTFPAGPLTFTVKVSGDAKTLVFPHDSPVESNRANTYSALMVASDAPVTLFNPSLDVPYLASSRSLHSTKPAATSVAGSGPGLKAYPFGNPSKVMADDYTSSLYVGDRVADRGSDIAGAKSVHIKLKGLTASSVIHVTLVERDGSAWSSKVPVSRDWAEVVIPIETLQSARSVMLPQGYPGNWSYWLSFPNPGHRINLPDVERLQFSIRNDDFSATDSTEPPNSLVAIESVSLQF
jgi:hypothetical protein